MNIANIIKIIFYIAVILFGGFLFERLSYKGKFLRYAAPFLIAALFGFVLYFVLWEEWFAVAGPFLMLFVGSCSNYALFGEKNGKFRFVLIPVAVLAVVFFFFVRAETVKFAEMKDSRIAELNDSVTVYRGTFRMKEYSLDSIGVSQFNPEDYPEPYYFSYLDVSKNAENSDDSGLPSIDFPCLPTEENLSEIKTLVFAVRHSTTGQAYDEYINGVGTGEKTIYNDDLSFLIVNLDTKECCVLENALYGSDAGYNKYQPEISKFTARNYVGRLYSADKE